MNPPRIDGAAAGEVQEYAEARRGRTKCEAIFGGGVDDERAHDRHIPASGGSERRLGSQSLHRACGFVILGAVAWIALGEILDLEIFGLTPLYVGEVLSVYAFGVSWIAKGRDLLKRIFRAIL